MRAKCQAVSQQCFDKPKEISSFIYNLRPAVEKRNRFR